MEEEAKNKTPNEWLSKRNSLNVANIPGSVDSEEKLLEIFKVHGKCEIQEFNASAHTAKVFYFHHKGAKKAKDKMDGSELDGQKLSVDWFYVFDEKEKAISDEKKSKREPKKESDENKASKKATKTEKATKSTAVNTVDDCETLQKRLDAEIKSRIKLDAKVDQMKNEIKLLQLALAALTNKQ